MKSHQKFFKKSKSFEESNRSPIKRKAKKTISEPRKYNFKDFSSLRIRSVKKSVKSRISLRAQKHSLAIKNRHGFNIQCITNNCIITYCARRVLNLRL